MGIPDQTIEEHLAGIEMTVSDIDDHLRRILSYQVNHKPANTDIVDFWLDQRLILMGGGTE